MTALLHAEFSYCALVFHKYQLAEEQVSQAQKDIGLQVALTGRLGRRTKYQTFDTAQLVLDAKSETGDFIFPKEEPNIYEDPN